MNLPAEDRLRVEAWIRDGLSRRILLSDYRLFFFGSRVTDAEPSLSDIDVGIEKIGGGSLPPGVLAEMSEYVREVPTLYKIDFVDFGEVADAFREVALQKIELFAA